MSAGLAATDTLPKFMLEENLEEAPFRWDFDPDEIKDYWDDF